MPFLESLVKPSKILIKICIIVIIIIWYIENVGKSEYQHVSLILAFITLSLLAVVGIHDLVSEDKFIPDLFN